MSSGNLASQNNEKNTNKNISSSNSGRTTSAVMNRYLYGIKTETGGRENVNVQAHVSFNDDEDDLEHFNEASDYRRRSKSHDVRKKAGGAGDGGADDRSSSQTTRIRNKEIERHVTWKNVHSLLNIQNNRLISEKEELNQLNKRLDQLVESIKVKKAQNDDLQEKIVRYKEDAMNEASENGSAARLKKQYMVDLNEAKHELNEVSQLSTLSKIRASRSLYDLDKLREQFDTEMRYQTKNQEKIRMLENQRAESLHELSYLKENCQHREKCLLEDAEKNQKLREQLRQLGDRLDAEQELRVDLECKMQTMLEQRKFDEDLFRMMREELQRLFIYQGENKIFDSQHFYDHELREIKEKIREDFHKLNEYSLETMREEYERKIVQTIEEVETTRRVAEENARAAQAEEEQQMLILNEEFLQNQNELNMLREREASMIQLLEESKRRLNQNQYRIESERQMKDDEVRHLEEHIANLKNDLCTMLSSSKALDSEVAVYARLLNERFSQANTEAFEVTSTFSFENYKESLLHQEQHEREFSETRRREELHKKQCELEQQQRRLKELEAERERERERQRLLRMQQEEFERQQREFEEQERLRVQREQEELARIQREKEEQERIRIQREFEEQERLRVIREREEYERQQREIQEEQRRQREAEEQERIRRQREYEEKQRIFEEQERVRKQREQEELERARKQRELEEQENLRRLREAEEQERLRRQREYEEKQRLFEEQERARKQREQEELQRAEEERQRRVREQEEKKRAYEEQQRRLEEQERERIRLQQEQEEQERLRVQREREEQERARKQREHEEQQRRLEEERARKQREYEEQERIRRQVEKDEQERLRRQRELEEQQRQQREMEEQERLRRQREMEEQRRIRELEEQQRRLEEQEKARRQKESEEQERLRRQRELEQQEQRQRERELQIQREEIERQRRRQRELEEQQRRQAELEEQERMRTQREIELQQQQVFEQQRRQKEYEQQQLFEHQKRHREMEQRNRRESGEQEHLRRQRECEEQEKQRRIQLEHEEHQKYIMEKLKQEQELIEIQRRQRIIQEQRERELQEREIRERQLREREAQLHRQQQMQQQQQQQQQRSSSEIRCVDNITSYTTKRIVEEKHKSSELYEEHRVEHLPISVPVTPFKQQAAQNGGISRVSVSSEANNGNGANVTIEKQINIQLPSGGESISERPSQRQVTKRSYTREELVTQQQQHQQQQQQRSRSKTSHSINEANASRLAQNRRDYSNVVDHCISSNNGHKHVLILNSYRPKSTVALNQNGDRTEITMTSRSQSPPFERVQGNGSSGAHYQTGTGPRQQGRVRAVSGVNVNLVSGAATSTSSLNKNVENNSKYAIKHKANRYVSGAIGILETSLNGEYVILENLSSNKNVNLKGWYIHRYVPDQNINVIYKFTNDTVLCCGEKLKILSRSGHSNRQHTKSMHEGLNNIPNGNGGSKGLANEKVILANNVENWGTYSKFSVTKLINAEGVDKAVLTQSLLRLATSSNNVNIISPAEVISNGYAKSQTMKNGSTQNLTNVTSRNNKNTSNVGTPTIGTSLYIDTSAASQSSPNVNYYNVSRPSTETVTQTRKSMVSSSAYSSTHHHSNTNICSPEASSESYHQHSTSVGTNSAHVVRQF